jgi:hypothetical protein
LRQQLDPSKFVRDCAKAHGVQQYEYIQSVQVPGVHKEIDQSVANPPSSCFVVVIFFVIGFSRNVNKKVTDTTMVVVVAQEA